MPQLLPLVALVLVALTATAQEPAPAPHSLIAVPGPLSPRQAHQAHKLLPAYYGDQGAFALGEGDAQSLAALRAAGLAAADLGPVSADERLLLVDADHLPDNGRVLFRHAGLELFAVPAAPDVGGMAEPSGCGHHGPRFVERTAHRLGEGFVAPIALSAEEGLSVDSRITPLVADVQSANIQALVSTLSAISSRRADEAGILQARDILLAELATIPGLDAVTTFEFATQFAPNVVAEITGSVNPERVVVLGAHYDSINGAGPGTTAPGADDNASGSGGLLEAARLLSTLEFENTLRLVWFSAEEFGLVGAGAYADALLVEGVEPVGMLNMDMISHRDNGDARDLDFATNNTDAALTQFCRDIAAAYVPSLPTVTGVLTAGSSDHAAFQARGIPAVFFFEDLQQFSSVIHTSGDTLGSSANDFTLAREITKVFVASAATLAEPVDMQLTHTPLGDTSEASGPFVVEADVTSLAGGDVANVNLVVSVDGGPEQIMPLLEGLEPNQWLGSIPGGAPTARIEYHLVATNTEGATEFLPEGIAPGAQRFRFKVGEVDVAFESDFDAAGDLGFTSQQIATQDDWQRGVPTGAAGDPSSAFSGANVWGNDIGQAGFNGAYQPNVFNRLRAPSINTLGKSGLELEFQRWLTVEEGQFDQARVLVNGQVVWSNPLSGNLIDASWTPMNIDVSAFADNQAAVQIDFELQSDGGLEFGGWNLDDLRLASLSDGSLDELRQDRAHVSISQGGSVGYSVDFGPAFAGRTYLLLMSLSGSAPGTPLGGSLAPVNFDLWTNFGLRLAATGNPLVPGFTGTLSAEGAASGSLIVPPLLVPEAAGLTITTAAITMFPIDTASNAVDLLVLP